VQVVAVEARHAERTAEIEHGRLRHNPFAPIRATLEEFRVGTPDWFMDRYLAAMGRFSAGLAAAAPLLARYPGLLTPARRLPPRPVHELEPCTVAADAMRAAVLTSAHSGAAASHCAPQQGGGGNAGTGAGTATGADTASSEELAQLEELISLCDDMQAYARMMPYAFIVHPQMQSGVSNRIPKVTEVCLVVTHVMC
jgi:hypothetical protein